MNLKLITFTCIILICSCTASTRLAKDKNRKTGAVVKSVHLDAGWHKIAYQGYQSAYKETMYECQLYSCDSAVRERKLADIPAGGRVIIYLSAATPEECTPGNFDYVVKDAGGNVIKACSGDAASVPSYIHNAWQDIDAFDIPQPVTYPFSVFLINKLDNSRSEFLVKSGN